MLKLSNKRVLGITPISIEQLDCQLECLNINLNHDYESKVGKINTLNGNVLLYIYLSIA